MRSLTGGCARSLADALAHCSGKVLGHGAALPRFPLDLHHSTPPLLRESRRWLEERRFRAGRDLLLLPFPVLREQKWAHTAAT
jgi:hypothetical protein